MSTVPAFKTVIYWSPSGVQVFWQAKKGWESKVLPLKKGESVPELPNAVKENISGTNTLVLLSDSYNGHLQMVLPNKKEELTDDHIGTLLHDQYEIDLDSYEFASQRFTLSREQVQVSITGVEKSVYQNIVEFLTISQPKKSWIMPFGWFLAPLKALEPVLLAVVKDKDQVMVSHHYLGVDDAREIQLSELSAYARARKGERKETHLIYVQAPEKTILKLEKELDGIVVPHALLDTCSADPLQDVVEAVLKKGEETLAELLHFTVDVPASEVESETQPEEEIVATSKVSPSKQAEENEVVEVSVGRLPKPSLPPSLAVPVAPELDTPEELQEEPTSDDDEEEVVELPPAAVVKNTEEVEEEETQEVETSKVSTLLSELKSAKGERVEKANRYVDVAPPARWKTIFLVFFAVTFLTVLIGGAVFWSQQVRPQSQQSLLPPSPTPVMAPTPEPTPEPVASESAGLVDKDTKAKTSILLLNATGVNGLAGKRKATLTAAGWAKVQTGNATGSYSDAVFVSAKDEILLKAIDADIAPAVTSVKEVKEANAQKYDVVIILADEAAW